MARESTALPTIQESRVSQGRLSKSQAHKLGQTVYLLPEKQSHQYTSSRTYSGTPENPRHAEGDSIPNTHTHLADGDARETRKGGLRKKQTRKENGSDYFNSCSAVARTSEGTPPSCARANTHRCVSGPGSILCVVLTANDVILVLITLFCMVIWSCLHQFSTLACVHLTPALGSYNISSSPTTSFPSPFTFRMARSTPGINASREMVSWRSDNV